jgi:hypothetical protein
MASNVEMIQLRQALALGNFDAFNARVDEFGKRYKDLFKADIIKLANKGKNRSKYVHINVDGKDKKTLVEKKLADSLQVKFRSESGTIYRISFPFIKHGIYVALGVGRGYEMQGGNVVRTAASVLKDGFVGREPKDWIKPRFEQARAELTVIVAEEFAKITLTNYGLKLQAVK